MRWFYMILGILLAVSGTIWTLQGLDVFGQDGGMNGQTMWVVIGPITAIAGLFVFRMGLRKKPTAP